MADEVAQVPAAQGVEAAQAVVQDDPQANNSCRCYFSFGLCWLCSPFVPVSFRQFVSSLVFLLYTLASCYLAASSICFYCFPSFIFLLRAFLSVLACCISFGPLVTFHLLLHGFVPPLVF